MLDKPRRPNPAGHPGETPTRAGQRGRRGAVGVVDGVRATERETGAGLGVGCRSRAGPLGTYANIWIFLSLF